MRVERLFFLFCVRAEIEAPRSTGNVVTPAECAALAIPGMSNEPTHGKLVWCSNASVMTCGWW